MSFAVVSVVFLRLPSAGRNDRQVLALDFVVYRSDCMESQRIEEPSAARERNRRSYSATATKSKRRVACKIVCWYETSSGVRSGCEWPTMPTKLVQASSQSVNQPNPLSSGNFRAAGRQGHRQTYPLTTGKYAPGPSHWWARGGVRTPFQLIGQPQLYPQSYDR